MDSSIRSPRQPAVAGSFYPGEKNDLYEMIHRCFTHDLGPGKFPSLSKDSEELARMKSLGQNETLGQLQIPQLARAAVTLSSDRVRCWIVPHAGYEYSGPVAAHAYFKVFEFIATKLPYQASPTRRKKVTAVILGPNHYGIGSGIAVPRSDSWETPLGSVPVDQTFLQGIIKSSDIIDVDDIAHSREHSIEVQIPFLQVVASLAHCDLTIVPICLMLQDRETTEQVGEAIISALESSRRKKSEEQFFVILGSSDLTHYEPQESAYPKDQKLLAKIENLELLEFYGVLERLNVSACGYGAIAAVMRVARSVDVGSAHVLKYATSGDATGSVSSVVGYSAVEFV